MAYLPNYLHDFWMWVKIAYNCAILLKQKIILCLKCTKIEANDILKLFLCLSVQNVPKYE